MKKISIYTFLFASLLLSWSCGEDSNMEAVGNWEITAPVLTTPSSSASVVLDETAPTEEVNFAWQPAMTSNRFGVGYRFLLVAEESADLTNPLLDITPTSSGKDLFVKLTADQLDYALWTKCFEPGQAVDLKWVVVAKAIEKEVNASSPISITRFETDRIPQSMVITGAGTEAGDDVAAAAPMRARKNGDGETTGIFDVYTTLTEGQTFAFRDQPNSQSKMFGGSDGSLEGCGSAIAAPATGQYRVVADLNNSTYNFLKIDKWSLVGDAVPGGWGGDVPLNYTGNGVWQAEVDFQYPYDGAGFIFRANGDWGYIIKQVKGTVSADGKSGSVLMESEAGDAGVELEDSKIGQTGIHTVTLDLRNYKFSIVPKPVDPGDNMAVIGKTTSPESDKVTGNFLLGEYDTPETLFLISEGEVVGELIKDGEIFTTAPAYVALEAGKTYILNDASDGSGTTYNESGDGAIAVDHDQAYLIRVDFSSGKLFWEHYNLKLFHWDDAGGGWDARQEILMTYTHPYKFEVTANLSAGFDTKFISPWAVQFGTSATALTGTMQNSDPSPNFKGITQPGSYKATIIVAEDFSSGEYSFVKQ
jgi:starch-binding outer membrane protein SusE/F